MFDNFCIFQLTSSSLDSKLREDLERLKKIKAHRGLRHYWGYVYQLFILSFILFFILTIFLNSYWGFKNGICLNLFMLNVKFLYFRNTLKSFDYSIIHGIFWAIVHFFCLSIWCQIFNNYCLMKTWKLVLNIML